MTQTKLSKAKISGYGLNNFAVADEGTLYILGTKEINKDYYDGYSMLQTKENLILPSVIIQDMIKKP